ncbi:MAG: hypothetical protein CM1200mP30_28170 [Pseudomonadota bacterium]|nr:MAG: hypothetical protein CM1200mP30_28170 [Pseudomonadota bacterium]
MVLLNASQKRGKPFMYTRIDQRHVRKLLGTFGISKKSLWKNLSVEQRQLILYGNTKMKLGVRNIFRFPGMLLKKLDKEQWADLFQS